MLYDIHDPTIHGADEWESREARDRDDAALAHMDARGLHPSEDPLRTHTLLVREPGGRWYTIGVGGARVGSGEGAVWTWEVRPSWLRVPHPVEGDR